MKVEPISSAHIAAIWQGFDLGEVRSITAPRRGCSNACFLVNDNRVARFQVTDLPRHKFRTEKAAYALLRGSAIPVPEVLVLDESLTLLPYAFLITTRLPGETVYDSWPCLDGRTREQLAFEAGRYLALLHQHTLPAFGSLSELAEGCFPTWSAYPDDEAARNVRRARDEGLLDTATTTRIARLLVRSISTGCSCAWSALPGGVETRKRRGGCPGNTGGSSSCLPRWSAPDELMRFEKRSMPRQPPLGVGILYCGLRISYPAKTRAAWSLPNTKYAIRTPNSVRASRC